MHNQMFCTIDVSHKIKRCHIDCTNCWIKAVCLEGVQEGGWEVIYRVVPTLKFQLSGETNNWEEICKEKPVRGNHKGKFLWTRKVCTLAHGVSLLFIGVQYLVNAEDVWSLNLWKAELRFVNETQLTELVFAKWEHVGESSRDSVTWTVKQKVLESQMGSIVLYLDKIYTQIINK